MIIIYASPSGAGKTTSTRTFFKGYREDGKDFSKDVGFLLASGRLEDLADETIVTILRAAFQAFTPVYRFLLAVSDDYFSKTTLQ